MQKSIEEIVNETLAYYEEDPSRRAVDENGGCEYLTEDGRMCAVGRCMCEDAEPENLEGIASHIVKKGEGGTTPLEPLLRPEYRGHPLDFWQELQALHDSCTLWIGDRRHDRRVEADGIIAAFSNPTN